MSQPPSSLLNGNSGRSALKALTLLELSALVIGTFALLADVGFGSAPGLRFTDLDGIVVAALTLILICRVAEAFRTGERVSLVVQRLLIPAVWAAGTLYLFVASATTETVVQATLWSKACLGVAAAAAVLRGCRTFAARTDNSAVLLAGSFLVLIAVGTLLLKLPMCRMQAAGQTDPIAADWDVALFTATSASCVTGLVVEPTGSFWSTTGHIVIFCLFQIGGLGILTFGAFAAVLSGRRGMEVREARTLQDMLDMDNLLDARRLLLTIVMFTLIIEMIGTVSLLGMWPDLGLGARIWQALFHSVSAFCNAGFSLNDNGFLGLGTRWQVWGPVSILIILGGLGFTVVSDLLHYFWPRRALRTSPLFRQQGIRRRLSLHSRLVIWSGIGLLLSGTMGFYVLESLNTNDSADIESGRRVADAWFQSVTFRTAGFHTVDHGEMHLASKLLAIFLMFIGAAPGSTGGGVKTVVFAVTVMNIRAVMKGRSSVEAFGRRIPVTQVSRALAMIAAGLGIVLLTTGLLVIFENQPDRFIDHLFEATSAFGTVGVSTGITSDLRLPSRLLITIVMFLGRIGPITLLLAMARHQNPENYQFPTERVNLG